MTEPKEPKGASVNTHDEFSHWDLPDISQEKNPSLLNMFGRNSLQIQVEDPLETETILPPTLSEIEDIRAHAEQEGFAEGQEKGFTEGLEKGRLEGLEQGHGEGYSQGQQQGYEEGLKTAAEMLQRFENLLGQFEAPLALLDTEIEKELLTTSMTLAKAVIGHELKTYPEHILSALRQGVDSLPIKEQRVNIRVTPSDEALIGELYSQTQLERNRWQIEADPSLSPGDCIIDSVRSHIDMTVETRIGHVFSELDKHQHDLLQIKEQQEEALLSSRQLNAEKNAQHKAEDTVQGAETSVESSLETVDSVTASSDINEGEYADSSTPTAP
ncbi:flagellar assembly protein FliH [Shewanella halifaxensis HAW-EB4]|uniref:Flagellar assembly protein FliH n=1 Tax=Shewanella halifaxensis (strain HAW-EB4) TaxID=458817 RepID=B0TME7_SHEHH|nr:flagellar assembly protein FliH [Shewanella halifaxensis]ABZ76016.1 flagellar assembly protein FliH [Shewanella halifaxensis HAW-EB4]